MLRGKDPFVHNPNSVRESVKRNTFSLFQANFPKPKWHLEIITLGVYGLEQEGKQQLTVKSFFFLTPQPPLCS